MYDWANSAVQTTIIAAIFPIYFQKVSAAGLPGPEATSRFAWACVLTLGAQFAVGASRTVVTRQRWWTSGVEMLLVGAVAAAVAWGAGRIIGQLTGTTPVGV